MHTKFRLLDGLNGRLKKFTAPNNKITRPEEQRKSNLVSAAIMTLLCITGFSFATFSLLDSYPITSTDLMAAVFIFATLIPAYYLSRTPSYRYAVLILVAAIIISIWFLVAIPEVEGSYYLLYYFIFPILLSSIFLSDQTTFGIYIIVIVATLLIPSISSFVGTEDLPTVFLTLFSIMIVIINRHNRLVDQDRHQALSNSEEEYRTLFETLSDLVIVHQDGIIVKANNKSTDFIEYPPEDIIGQNVLEFFPEDEKDKIKEKVKNQRAEAYETRLITKSGREIMVEISGQYYTYNDKLHRVAIVRNIEERKQTEEQKLDLALERQKVTLMQRFIKDASHDLRTPITVLMTSLHLLSYAQNQEDRNKRISQLTEQTTRLSGLVEDLFTISRLEKAAIGVFNFRLDDVNTVAQEIYEEQLIFADISNVYLKLSNTRTKLLAMIDADELKRALRQLVTNAIHYTPEEGQITIDVYSHTNHIYFEVEDTGIGMSEEIIEHIFDPFYRADRARSTNNGGMGLGLAITRNIVEAHGGTISVKSKPGKGSKFQVVLPASAITEELATNP